MMPTVLIAFIAFPLPIVILRPANPTGRTPHPNEKRLRAWPAAVQDIRLLVLARAAFPVGTPAAAMKSWWRSGQLPWLCELEEDEPSADFIFAPVQAHAALLVTRNPMTATKLSNRLDIGSPPFCRTAHAVWER
jgi:hypothetical protein